MRVSAVLRNFRLLKQLSSIHAIQLAKSSCNNAKKAQLRFYKNSSSKQHPRNVYLVDETADNGSYTTGCNKYTDRTYHCGELRTKNVGEKVTLCGWLEFQRMNKFIVLRDGYGHTQLITEQLDVETQKLISGLPFESIIKVKGTVLSRPKEMVNPKQATGDIEVQIHSLEVLNKAHDLPFNIRDFQMPKEALRMQYRYLGLRFPELQRNLRVRSEFLMHVREFLVHRRGFVDVETPTLFKATPGGAQEFVVPTRFPGQFYSLVQSPQQFKQMLMAGSIDRYFQIARCYRDEGCRSDRQPEFTQLDVEMSFTHTEGVMALIEEVLEYSWPDILPLLPRTFPRMSYQDALERYGSDKPDVRYDFTLHNCTEILRHVQECSEDFGGFCLVFPEPYVHLPNSSKQKYLAMAEKHENIKLVMNKIEIVEDWASRVSRLLGEESVDELIKSVELQNKSVIFLAYGKKADVLTFLGNLRLEYIKGLEEQGHKLKKSGMFPLWITDFPLFEEDNSGHLISAHHPFTSPHLDDLHLLETHPLKVRAQAYDLVLNGNEVGGGSIRIHDSSLQERIFKLLNIDKSFMRHLLDMLNSGCPPHGGIALGLDRLLATMLGAPSIRDVIAFPKTFEGRDPVSGAPSEISEEVLKLYHLKSK